MGFKKKRNVAITAGLTVVLALSPVVVPVASAFAEGNAPVGETSADTQSAQNVVVDFVIDGQRVDGYTDAAGNTLGHFLDNVDVADAIAAKEAQGLRFVGWQTKAADSDIYQMVDESYVVTGNAVFMAVFEPAGAATNTFTVEFHDMAGVTVDYVTLSTESDAIAFTEFVNGFVAEHPEYAGTEWSLLPTGAVLPSSNAIGYSLNVYALASEEPVDPEATTYDVTFDDCLDNTENQVVTVNEGESINADDVKTPSCEGYTFVGWYTDTALTQAFNFDSPITSDMTVFAKWEKNADQVTPGEGTQTPTDPATEQAAEDAVPNTGDATVAVSGIAGLGAALAGLGAFLKRRRA
ncbi:InlB B-repeat-containing protein [Olsenella profusa]|uniref:InlB B-repeat-containing protein n=1 Tax=Olsenella profusa TaxID=138595 RepID=A0ABS2F3I4_9ACTN|nr:InlB B-repeat-containing protein [Olsenella profusa]MBM6775561.1 InlB B-repeat-containing protein [Olsenella profusa]